SVDPLIDPKRRQGVFNTMLDIVEKEAGSEKLPITLIDVPEHDIELANVLRRRGYSRSRRVPMTYLDICWSSFDKYSNHLGDVSPNARKDLKHKLNKNRKSGTTISVLGNIGPNADRLHELLTLNYRKYGGQPFSFDKHFFSDLRLNLGENALFHVSHKAGLMTGVAVELRWNEASHMCLVGIDHEQAGNDMTYFVVCHYSPISAGIAS